MDENTETASTTVVQEQPVTAEGLHLDYEAMRQKHQAKVQRLHGLEMLRQETDLTPEQLRERRDLLDSIEAREPRLQALLRKAQTTQKAEDFDILLATWPELVAQKIDAWTRFVQAIDVVRSRLKDVEAIHIQQEAVRLEQFGFSEFKNSAVVFWPRRGDLISPGLVVAWQTNSQRYLEPSARVGGARAHIRSRLA